MIIRKAKTRGGKYCLELHQTTATLFDIKHLVNGNSTGRNCNISGLSKANAKFDEIVVVSAAIDNIKYKE